MDQIGNIALSSSSTSTPPRGRQTKFTPERMRQIVNLVERGKSREEIAELVGVTVGTLQVTCSRFGISLRRPRFDTGTGYLRPRKSAPAMELPRLKGMATPRQMANWALSCPCSPRQRSKLKSQRFTMRWRKRMNRAR